ncbi:MAG: hypothetical protein II803_05445, partial [Firmicutes bacterium]|nr:hypothetical protein [Bacillota bacterium]
MDKRERFQRYLKGEPVDRVPLAIFHHFTTRSEWLKGLQSEAIFEKNIMGHKAAREKFDPDVIKVMNDSLMIMPVDVSGVETAEDLRKIQPPLPGSPFFEKTRELTERVLAFYEDSEAPKYVTGFSPAMILKTSMNLTFPSLPNTEPKLLQLLKEDPEAVAAALDIIADSVITLDEMLLKECGADAVYLSVNNQAGYFPGDVYRKYITPSEKKVLAHANSLSDMTLLHICGYAGLANDLRLYEDYEAAAFNWAVHAEGVSLSEGKKLFKGKPVFGGFEQEGVIYKGSREELEKAVFAILDEAGQLGVMIGDDCTVPANIDDTRLQWVREACEKYAKEH